MERFYIRTTFNELQHFLEMLNDHELVNILCLQAIKLLSVIHKDCVKLNSESSDVLARSHQQRAPQDELWSLMKCPSVINRHQVKNTQILLCLSSS